MDVSSHLHKSGDADGNSTFKGAVPLEQVLVTEAAPSPELTLYIQTVIYAFA